MGGGGGGNLSRAVYLTPHPDFDVDILCLDHHLYNLNMK